MLYQNISLFSIIAGIGLLAAITFLLGLIVNAIKKKPLKVWAWGLIISIVTTFVAYVFAFSGIFQLYTLSAN